MGFPGMLAYDYEPNLTDSLRVKYSLTFSSLILNEQLSLGFYYVISAV